MPVGYAMVRVPFMTADALTSLQKTATAMGIKPMPLGYAAEIAMQTSTTMAFAMTQKRPDAMILRPATTMRTHSHMTRLL